MHLGNKNEGSELSDESQEFNVDNIENSGGDMHIGDENKDTKIKSNNVWIIIAIGAIVIAVAGYYFSN